MHDDGDHIKVLVQGGYRLVWPVAWPYCVLCGKAWHGLPPALGGSTRHADGRRYRDPFCTGCRDAFPISCAALLAWIAEIRVPDGVGGWLTPASVTIPP